MKDNQMRLGAILSYVTLIVSNLIGIVYTPIMLRIMGKSEYGLYSLVASIIGYLSILDLGLGNAIVRYTTKYRVSNDKHEEFNLNGMFLILYTGIGLFAAVIGFILCSNMDHIFASKLSSIELNKAKLMMGIMILNLSISFPLSIFGAIMTAYERFVFPKIINIIIILINPIIMVPLLFMGYKSIAVVVVTALLNIVCLLINVWYCFRNLKIKIKFNDLKWGILLEISGYSFYIFLNIIIDKIFWSTDQFVLGMVAGTATIAVYAIATQFIMYYMNFSTAISGVFLPKITIMVSKKVNNNELSELFIKIGRLQYILMGFILSGFILFGKQFIRIWAGQAYESAFYMALIIMIPLTIPLIQTLGITILQAKNIHGFRSIIYIIIAFINLGMSVVLSKKSGGFGCSIATSISLIVGHFFIMNIYYHKKVKLNIISFWKNIMGLSIPLGISMIIGLFLKQIFVSEGIFYMIIQMIIFTLVYLFFMWVIGVNTYEKNIIKRPLKKIKVKLIEYKI